MSLLQLKNASIILGHPPLLNGIELVIHPGERLCLVGRNGCGKSTLLKVIEADIKLDDGQRLVNKEVKISRLPQDPPASVQCSLFDYVAEGLAEVGEYLKGYFHQANLIAEDPSDANMAKLEFFQQQLDHHNGWQLEQRIQQVLTKLQLDPNQQLSNLSGGWRRKAALAKAMASEPDILLLDEPTSALDLAHQQLALVATHQLARRGCALVVVIHDLNLMASIADQILVLDNGCQIALGCPEQVFTTTLFKEVFGVDVTIGHHPQEGYPMITPLRPTLL